MQQLWKLFSLGISPGVFIDGNHISSQPHPSSLFYFLLRSQHTRSLLFHSSLSASFCTFNDSNCTYYFSLTDCTGISLLSTRTPKAYGAFLWLFAVTLWSASSPGFPQNCTDTVKFVDFSVLLASEALHHSNLYTVIELTLRNIPWSTMQALWRHHSFRCFSERLVPA